MLKNIVKYIGIGISYGIGFAVAVSVIVFVIEKVISTNSDYSSQLDEDKTNYLKSLIKSIEHNGTDQCGDLAGTWVGEFVEDDGAYIRSWELNYEEDGRFWGTMVEKSITESFEEKHEGTWECEHSVLFTDVTVEENNHKWNYLLLNNANGELVYAHIGRYSLENVYRAYRKKVN